MSRRRLGRIIVVLAVLALALTACSAAAAPTPLPIASPSVRVPLKCSQLFTVDAARALVGYPVSVKADETTTPVDIYAIAARQAGTLSCVWGGHGLAGETAGYNDQLEVDIAPDASTAYATNVAAIYAGTSPTSVNTPGVKSESLCDLTSYFFCGAEMLVGTYWVSVQLQNDYNLTISSDVANTRIQQVLTIAAATLRDAKPAAAWKPPASKLPTICSSTHSRATLQKILGMTALEPTPTTSGATDAYFSAFSGAASCQSRDDLATETGIAKVIYVDFEVLKGGAWSLQALVRSPHNSEYFGTYRAVKIPGTNAAVLACSISSDCSAIVAINNNVIEIDLEVPSTTKSITNLKPPSAKRTIATVSELIRAIGTAD